MGICAFRSWVVNETPVHIVGLMSYQQYAKELLPKQDS